MSTCSQGNCFVNLFFFNILYKTYEAELNLGWNHSAQADSWKANFSVVLEISSVYDAST